jgi:mono/diheme cytochrome c family protein
MPPFDALNNRQAAAVATFVRNAWGNEFGVVLPDYVDRLR